MTTASRKVEEVNQRLQQEGNSPDIVIGADSVVVHNSIIYEKPADKADAFRILRELSGKKHTVYTGVVMVNNADGASLQFYEGTDVYMTNMSDKIIRAYIETGEPLDKAGAYGIQEQGRTLVERIEGDYFNVVGLPVNALCKNIYKILGIPLT